MFSLSTLTLSVPFLCSHIIFVIFYFSFKLICWKQVPPDAVEPLFKQIVNQFVHDRSRPEVFFPSALHFTFLYIISMIKVPYLHVLMSLIDIARLLLWD